jgi:hypothetical protein
MACDTFLDCVSDPFAANERFENLSNLSRYSINLTLYIVYALLIIWTGYSLVKAIYTLFGAADESESYEKFRGGITNAVFAAIGIVAIFSARFVLKLVLDLLGISGTENIFGDGLLL